VGGTTLATPIFLNTGGGIFGAIRKRVAEDANLRDVFGDRVKPGRRSGRGEFPYLSLSHVSGTIDDLFTGANPDGLPPRYDVWLETIQVSVYADNYEAARQLGRLVNSRISRQTFLVDCVEITLLANSRVLAQDPQRGPSAAEVWHYDFKYHYWDADKLLDDQYEAE
jgi:hypothetical protein